jgi:hypothetical protein
MKVTATAAACILGIVVAFQLALAAGAPWAAAAYGGRAARADGRLPARHRIASAVAAAVLVCASWLVLAASSVVGPGPLPNEVLTGGVWVLVGLLALNTVGNLAPRGTRSSGGARADSRPC